MKTPLLIALLTFAVTTQAAPSFTTIDVYLEAEAPFAAWQFELHETKRHMTVVGVESGASDAYPRAPYYDREAIAQGSVDRIVVADYSTMDAVRLPSGYVRIATVHVMLDTDNPEIELSLISAVNANGKVIDATISYQVP